jgi:transposase
MSLGDSQAKTLVSHPVISYRKAILNMIRILGLDVSKDNVTTCLLTEFPEPRTKYLEGDFERLYTNPKGIQRLLELKPDVAVLEPTGTNYSKIWCTKLAEAGVKLALVGHNQLVVYRMSLDLPDKDDEADALALACYYHQYQHLPGRFVRQRDEIVTHMRDLVLRLHHLNRVQSPLINRVKQDLAWAYPERAKTALHGRLFWRWLAGEGKSKRYDDELLKTCGAGLNDHVLFAAKQLYNLHEQEDILERQLRDCLSDAKFMPYRKVMARYGFGERTQALIISQIYPLENYLDPEGEPIVLLSRGKESKDKTLKRLSLRRFTSALGCANNRVWSGDKKASKKAGSELCRTALWQWCFTRIEVKKGRLKNDRFTAIAEEFDLLKSQKPIKLARSKIAARTTKRLFYDLVNELQGRSSFDSD